MFSKKNSFIKIEFLPEGKPLLTANINDNTDPELVSDFINRLITREYLEVLLDVVLESSKKNKAISVGEEICENVLSVQKDFQITPVCKFTRNPIIRPSQVMAELEGRQNDE